jgi:alkylation response protein AidB-like acyl-CoA dehydrogenase
VPYALDDRTQSPREWQRRCYDAGYVGRAWPTQFGGPLTRVEQIIVDEE